MQVEGSKAVNCGRGYQKARHYDRPMYLSGASCK